MARASPTKRPHKAPAARSDKGSPVGCGKLDATQVDATPKYSSLPEVRMSAEEDSMKLHTGRFEMVGPAGMFPGHKSLKQKSCWACLSQT